MNMNKTDNIHKICHWGAFMQPQIFVTNKISNLTECGGSMLYNPEY